jgi:quinoprotein glucose dehydrogenase
MIKFAFIVALAPFIAPLPASAQPQTWATFNGDLRAQKYSTETAITPANVHQLVEAWQTHTGDVSDGSGDKP